MAVPIAVDPTLDGFSVQPPLASLARGGAFVATFTVTAGPVPARLEILRGSTVVATPTVTSLAPGRQSLTWDGVLADGTTAPGRRLHARADRHRSRADLHPHRDGDRRLDAADDHDRLARRI